MKTFEEFLDPYNLEDWLQQVKRASQELAGNCPLLEDETIVKVNAYIQYIQNEIPKTPS